MATDCPMLEASSVGVDVEDDEIELSLGLGLSIGGSFRKSPNSKPEEQKICNSEALVGESEPETGPEYVDPQRKREIQALRRQEARRKREEKLRKGGGRGTNLMDGGLISVDTTWPETQRVQNRVRDREATETDADIAKRTRHNNTDEKVLGNKCLLNEAKLTRDGAETLSLGPSPIAMAPLQYQYVPFSNGLADPCFGPNACNNAGNVTRNLQQPVACRSFQPYQGNPNSGQFFQKGSDSEDNSGEHGSNRNEMANGSPVQSSSFVSAHQCSSGHGGSSSNAGSHSSHSKPEQSQLNESRDQLGVSEHSISSNHIESSQPNHKAANQTKMAVSADIKQSILPKLHKPTNSESNPDPVNKSVEPGQLKVTRQMPCVSTTGNDGKTITGFLYRYTTTEVSIVCVCHGSSFSPAEFVEHAGGKGVTHPLRHITVVPSMFG